MNYPYSVPPYIQAAMAQAFQAIMSGGPLPSNCFVVAIPMEQAQQMFPQLMMTGAPGGGGMMYPPSLSYYGQQYQPQIGPYIGNQQTNALVPYSQGYGQNYNYPVVPYNNSEKKSKKKTRHGKKAPSQPHSNVYDSSSFDSHMEDLSWSRLFGHHRRDSKQKNQDQAALSYDQKSSSTKKQRAKAGNSSTSSSTSSSSSSTTSDETIRRVTISTKQTSGSTKQPSGSTKQPSGSTKQPSGSTSSKQQTNSSLPFKYSSEFIPGTGNQKSKKSNKEDVTFKPDDIFVVKKPQPLSQK